LPDHEGACRADVHDIEVCQLFGQFGRSEGSVPADINTPQKNHECHKCPLRQFLWKSRFRDLVVCIALLGAISGIRNPPAPAIQQLMNVFFDCVVFIIQHVNRTNCIFR
jgi:hypothetical protein